MRDFVSGQLIKNNVVIQFLSIPENVALSRVTVAAVASQLDLTLNDLEEIKVATSEAVSNCIIHGYQNNPSGMVRMVVTLTADRLEIYIEDDGVGIPDIEQAMQPSYTTGEERMGLGFVFMKSFMDEVEVRSEAGAGTKVRLVKMFSPSSLGGN